MCGLRVGYCDQSFPGDPHQRSCGKSYRVVKPLLFLLKSRVQPWKERRVESSRTTVSSCHWVASHHRRRCVSTVGFCRATTCGTIVDEEVKNDSLVCRSVVLSSRTLLGSLPTRRGTSVLSTSFGVKWMVDNRPLVGVKRCHKNIYKSMWTFTLILLSCNVWVLICLTPNPFEFRTLYTRFRVRISYIVLTSRRRTVGQTYCWVTSLRSMLNVWKMVHGPWPDCECRRIN